MRNTKQPHKRHMHIMGLPWQGGNGQSFTRCMVAGCDYAEIDGKAQGKQEPTRQAEQGALFETWGDGYILPK